MARRFFVGGNWKMNGDCASIDGIIKFLNEGIQKSATEVVVAPPSPYLYYVKSHLSGGGVEVAAQNCYKVRRFFTRLSTDFIEHFRVSGRKRRIYGRNKSGNDQRSRLEMGYSRTLGAPPRFQRNRRAHRRQGSTRNARGPQRHLLHWREARRARGGQNERGKRNSKALKRFSDFKAFFQVNFRQLQAIVDKKPDWAQIVVAYEPVSAMELIKLYLHLTVRKHRIERNYRFGPSELEKLQRPSKRKRSTRGFASFSPKKSQKTSRIARALSTAAP